jgi:hypothetical protein
MFQSDFVMLLNNRLPHQDSKSNGLKSETFIYTLVTFDTLHNYINYNKLHKKYKSN